MRAAVECSSNVLIDTLWVDWFNASAAYVSLHVESYASCCSSCKYYQPNCVRFSYWPLGDGAINCKLFNSENTAAPMVSLAQARSTFSECTAPLGAHAPGSALMMPPREGQACALVDVPLSRCPQ